MARPTKSRRVQFMPEVTVFKPAGIPTCELKEETLTVEELEALRLKDMEGLDQAECAESMQVSRPTFQRVLGSAREKLARALVEGKAIRVEGGDYSLSSRRHRCRHCSSEYEESIETCPRCGAGSGDGAGGETGEGPEPGVGHGRGHGYGHGHGCGKSNERGRSLDCQGPHCAKEATEGDASDELPK